MAAIQGVAFAAGAVGLLGHYLQAQGFASDVSTIIVIATGFSVSFWARRRLDKVRTRFGPFSKVAGAVAESLDDINTWVHDHSLRIGLVIAVGCGVLVVLGRHLVSALLAGLASWQIAVVVWPSSQPPQPQTSGPPLDAAPEVTTATGKDEFASRESGDGVR